MKKKRPYYLLAWFLVEAVFFLTIAVVAVFIILNSIAGSTSGSITIFSNWYQVLLFVADCLCFVGVVTFFALELKQRKDLKKVKQGSKQDEKVL